MAGLAALALASPVLSADKAKDEKPPKLTVLSPSRASAPLTKEELAVLKPKDSFRECEHCPEMVVVPPGEFTMGSPETEKGRSDDEGPQHKVKIPKQFAVGKFEVTFGEWGACLAGGGCPDNKDYLKAGWRKADRPAVNIIWPEAKRYIAWLNEKVPGKPYRLLSEAEWEYAERAGSQTKFFWGGEMLKDKANCNHCGTKWDGQTAPAGSFPANAFGLHDMLGNVWEWVEDCYHDSYKDIPAEVTNAGAPWLTGCRKDKPRVTRGGSWDDVARQTRSATRIRNLQGYRYNAQGFRVARSLP
jgi:formylglycine-generating enzyme required for sulfatase activity